MVLLVNDRIVYVYFYPEKHRYAGYACYVGVGAPDRPLDHNHYNSASKHLFNLIKKYGQLPFVIIREGLTLAEAFVVERALIKVLGRRKVKTGLLVNLTDGGEGALGFKHDAKTIEKLRKVQAGRFWWLTSTGFAYRSKEQRSPEDTQGRENIRGKNFNNRGTSGKRWWTNVDGKSYLSTEPLSSDDFSGRKNLVTTSGRRWWTTPLGEEYRSKEPRSPDDAKGRSKTAVANMSAGALSSDKVSVASRKSIIKAKQVFLSSPKARELHRINSARSWTPERRADLAKKMRIKWSDPKVRESVGAKIAAAQRKPEVKARQRAGTQAAWDRRRNVGED